MEVNGKDIVELVHVPSGSVIFSGGGINNCGVINGTVRYILNKYIITLNSDGKKLYIYKKDRYKLIYTLNVNANKYSKVLPIIPVEETNLFIIYDEYNDSIKSYRLSDGFKISEKVNVTDMGTSLVNNKISCVVKDGYNYYNALLNTNDLTVYKDTSKLDYSTRVQLGDTSYHFINYDSIIKTYNEGKIYYFNSNTFDTGYFSPSVGTVIFDVTYNDYYIIIYEYSSYRYIACLKYENNKWRRVWNNKSSEIGYSQYHEINGNNMTMYDIDMDEKYILNITNGTYSTTTTPLNFGRYVDSDWFNYQYIEYNNKDKTLISKIANYSQVL